MPNWYIQLQYGKISNSHLWKHNSGSCKIPLILIRTYICYGRTLLTWVRVVVIQAEQGIDPVRNLRYMVAFKKQLRHLCKMSKIQSIHTDMKYAKYKTQPLCLNHGEYQKAYSYPKQRVTQSSQCSQLYSTLWHPHTMLFLVLYLSTTNPSHRPRRTWVTWPESHVTWISCDLNYMI